VSADGAAANPAVIACIADASSHSVMFSGADLLLHPDVFPDIAPGALIGVVRLNVKAARNALRLVKLADSMPEQPGRNPTLPTKSNHEPLRRASERSSDRLWEDKRPPRSPLGPRAAAGPEPRYRASPTVPSAAHGNAMHRARSPLKALGLSGKHADDAADVLRNLNVRGLSGTGGAAWSVLASADLGTVISDGTDAGAGDGDGDGDVAETEVGNGDEDEGRHRQGQK